MENKEHECKEAGLNTTPIITKTVFGHGDSSHCCYVICEVCGKKSKEFYGRGIFDNNTFREAQKDWDGK